MRVGDLGSRVRGRSVVQGDDDGGAGPGLPGLVEDLVDGGFEDGFAAAPVVGGQRAEHGVEGEGAGFVRAGGEPHRVHRPGAQFVEDVDFLDGDTQDLPGHFDDPGEVALVVHEQRPRPFGEEAGEGEFDGGGLAAAGPAGEDQGGGHGAVRVGAGRDVQLDGVGGGPEIRPHVGAFGVAEGAAAVEPRPRQGAEGLVVPELRHPHLITGQQLFPEQVLDVADLLQLHDPVVPLLQRGDPLRENCWGVGGDDPPGVVRALHVLALLDLGAAFGEGVDRIDRVGGDGCAGFLGLGHLGARGFQAAFEEVPGADLAVVDAADVGFHTGDVGEDLQPFPTRQFQILLRGNHSRPPRSGSTRTARTRWPGRSPGRTGG